jgi:hypothetical protein
MTPAFTITHHMKPFSTLSYDGDHPVVQAALAAERTLEEHTKDMTPDQLMAVLCFITEDLATTLAGPKPDMHPDRVARVRQRMLDHLTLQLFPDRGIELNKN